MTHFGQAFGFASTNLFQMKQPFFSQDLWLALHSTWPWQKQSSVPLMLSKYSCTQLVLRIPVQYDMAEVQRISISMKASAPDCWKGTGNDCCTFLPWFEL